MLIRLTIDRFEGDKAVLIAGDGETIIWPKNKLPENAHEGMSLNFNVAEKAEREKQDRQTAKDIINEIINHS